MKYVIECAVHTGATVLKIDVAQLYVEPSWTDEQHYNETHWCENGDELITVLHDRICFLTSADESCLLFQKHYNDDENAKNKHEW